MPVEPPLAFPGVLEAIDAALARTDWDGLALAGTQPAPAAPGDPPARVLSYPRLTLFERGRMVHVISRGGERVAVAGVPGQAIHFATRARDVRCWRAPVRFLGLAFRRDYLRVLRYDHPGGPEPRAPQPLAHHTRRPLAGAAAPLLAALDALAAGPPAAELRPAAGEIARALLRLARHHVAADLAGAGAPDRARRTWQEAMEFIEERLDEELPRDRVAAVLGLNPTYLSSLFTRHGGQSFQRTLEGLRVSRARALLAGEPGLTVAEVARRCGFADPGYFRRVFRRHHDRPPGRWRGRRAAT